MNIIQRGTSDMIGHMELGRGWSLEGIPEICEKTRECCMALFAFLKDTGLGCKI